MIRVFIIAINILLILSAYIATASAQDQNELKQMQKVFYKQIASPLEIKSALLLLENQSGGIVLKQLIAQKINNPAAAKEQQNADKTYAILAFVDSGLIPKVLLLSGNNAVMAPIDYSLVLSARDLYKVSDFESNNSGSSAELDSSIKLLQAESLFEQNKLAQLKQKVAEISRLNRLVQALNTVSSLERRLAELQQDREALANLIKLVPYQQLGARQAVLENQLALEMRAIREVYSRKAGYHSEHISPEKEQQLNSLIQQASKLNVDELKSRLYELRQASNLQEEEIIDLNQEGSNSEQDSEEQQIGTIDNPL